MDDNLRRLLHQKLVDGIAMPLPTLTRRDTWIPRVPGKVLAVIGMRRTGKTSLLWQELAGRLAASGMERSGLPWISLEDERFIGAGPELLDGLLESWFAMPVSR
jgi:predicted AAA+ superfamily ATPase